MSSVYFSLLVSIEIFETWDSFDILSSHYHVIISTGNDNIIMMNINCVNVEA